MRRKVTIEHIPYNSLHYDERVQREKPVPARVKKLAREWDFDKAGTLHVSQRSDGKYYIVEGNHRRLAALELGYGTTKARCECHRGLSLEQEAALFLALNDVRPVTAWDKFRVGLEAGDPLPIMVRDTLAKYGLKIGPQANDSTVCCITEVTKIAQRDPALLDDVFHVLTEAWGTRRAALERIPVAAMSTVLGRYNGECDRARLATKLAKYRGGPGALAGDAAGLADFRPIGKTRAAAEIIVDTYNKGASAKRLPAL